MIKVLSSCVFATTVGVTLALSCASAAAQDPVTTERRTAPETTSRTDYTRTDNTDDEGFNYGWLGLTGLLGLLGLVPRSAPQKGFTVRDGAGNVKQQNHT